MATFYRFQLFMTSQNRTYYEILGVTEDASFEEIRTAFRERAREFHPDLNKSPDAVDRMQEINEAYEVLRDEEQRAAYDRMHQTFTVPEEELTKAKDLVVFSLGREAFRFGYDVGARTPHRRSHISLGRLEDVPTGLWHAVYESALESALVGESFLTGQPRSVREAAKNALESEAARYAYRHALSERAASVTEAIIVDLSVHCLGMTASAVGAQLGASHTVDSLESEAWKRAFEAIQYGAASEMARRGGYPAMRAARDAGFLDAVMEEAVRKGFESFSVSVRRRAMWGIPEEPDPGDLREAFNKRRTGGRAGPPNRGDAKQGIHVNEICATILSIPFWIAGAVWLFSQCAGAW